MNEANADSSAARRAGGWTRRRWLAMLMAVFAAQVAVIFALGGKHFAPPRTVTNAVQFALADDSSDLIALSDPTLFALPHAGDFSPDYWGQLPAVPPANFPRTEPVLPSLLATENLGTLFIQFMQTNVFATPHTDFKLAPKFSEPVVSFTPVFAANSSLRIEGNLARRKLLTPVVLTNWPYADVIAPSQIQALVDADGGVVSAIELPPENLADAASHYSAADQRAMEIAQGLRFAPASSLTVGRMIFNWRTAPLSATNSSVSAP